MPGEIPYKKYTRVKNLAAAVAEDQKILYFINLLFYSVHARAAIGNSYGALSQGTVGALSGHCQGTVRALPNACENKKNYLIQTLFEVSFVRGGWLLTLRSAV